MREYAKTTSSTHQSIPDCLEVLDTKDILAESVADRRPQPQVHGTVSVEEVDTVSVHVPRRKLQLLGLRYHRVSLVDGLLQTES